MSDSIHTQQHTTLNTGHCVYTDTSGVHLLHVITAGVHAELLQAAGGALHASLPPKHVQDTNEGSGSCLLLTIK